MHLDLRSKSILVYIGLYFKRARRLQGMEIHFFGQEFNIGNGQRSQLEVQGNEFQDLIRNGETRAPATGIERGTGGILAVGGFLWAIIATMVHNGRNPGAGTSLLATWV